MALKNCLRGVGQRLLSYWNDEGGLAVIEYGLLAGMITFAIFSFLTSMGGSLTTAFTGVNSDLQNAISSIQP